MKSILFLLLLPIVFWRCGADQASEKKLRVSGKTGKPSYQLADVEQGGVAAMLRLPGQLYAYQEVSIFPKVNGYVRDVYVDMGTKVSKGEILMDLEAPELEQASNQARERYSKSLTDLQLDKEKWNRVSEAARTAGAVSPFELSTLKSKLQADSVLSNAEKANWESQKTMLSYLKVTAPFSGLITERNIHPGALVSASSKERPMLELKQVDKLRLQVEIPEDLIPSIRGKDTISFFVAALKGVKLTGYINRKSSNLDPQFRSEKIQIDVINTDYKLSPGMYAEVLISAEGNARAMRVPKSAIITTTERKYVLLVENGQVKKVDVSVGNAGLDKAEVFGKLSAGDKVIVNANEDIPEGAAN